MARPRFNSNNNLPEPEKAKVNINSLKKTLALFKYLKPYRTKFIIGMVFLFLSSGASLMFPFFMGKLIDSAMLEESQGFFSNINLVAGSLMVVLFFQALFSFFRILLFVEVSEKTLADLRKETFFRIITLPMSFFAKRRVGELNSRISADLGQIQDTLTTTIAEAIRQVITLVGGIIFLSLVSGKLTLIMLSMLPVLIVVAVIFGKFIRKIAKEAQDKLADSNTIVEETLQGISSVKAFVNETYEALRYRKQIDAVIKIAIKGAKYRGAFASFVIFALFGAIVGVIWVGVHMVETGEISFGDLTSFILYSTFVGAAMGSFAELYAQIQKAVGATERVIEILDEKTEEISMETPLLAADKILHGELEFRDIKFSYSSRKEITVLDGVSFKVDAGKKLAIVGPSGAGKSTVTQLILRFYNPENGEMLYDGKPVSSFSLNDIRSQVAIVPQDVLLFGGTILENIEYGKIGASVEEIKSAAAKANAAEFIESFPEGYETIVGERGIKLSGGQRQRIAIARAVLKDPKILILDEATSSLDSESERLVQEALEELMKDRTSVIIAHRLSTIRQADQIIVLDKGSIVERGTHDELVRNDKGLYKHLSSLQFENRP
ncbi:MAG: ABC transporter fused permease/ATP-binding protein [Sphingobacteriales bacterium]|jgi:ABC transporter fused permease/ATP-binding protein